MSVGSGRFSLCSEDVAALVLCVTKLQDDGLEFKHYVDYAVNCFVHHNFLDVNRHSVMRSIDGLCQKFYIHSQIDRADALKGLCHRFIEHGIFQEHLIGDFHYSLLSLLIHLASKPTTVSCLDFPMENSIREENVPNEFDWRQILLEDEPTEDANKFELDDDDDLSDWSDYSDDPSYQTKELQDKKEDKVTMEETISASSSAIHVTNKPLYESNAKVTGRAWLCQNIQTPYWTGISVTHTHQNSSTIHLLGKIRCDCVEMTERQLLRETLWLLEGRQQLFVYSLVEDTFSVRSDLAVSHLSQASLFQILSTFAAYGTKLLVLRRFIESMTWCKTFPNGYFKTVSGGFVCKTYQAYSSALQNIICKLKRFLCDLERIVCEQREPFTLLMLMECLSSSFEKINALCSIHESGVNLCPKETSLWQKACWLQQVLYSSLVSSSTDFIYFNFSSLFLETVRPYIEIMDMWVSRGCQHDCWEEFALARNKDVQYSEENFWTKSVYIRGDHPSYMKMICKSLLEAGKSRELLCSLSQLTNKTESFKLTTCVPLYESFLERLSKTLNLKLQQEDQLSGEDLGKCGTAGEVEKSATNQSCRTAQDLIEVEARLECGNVLRNFYNEKNSAVDFNGHYYGRSLGDEISLALYREVNSRCMETFSKLLMIMDKDYGLQTTLFSIKKFFLMGSEDMFHFYSQVFDKISPNEIWDEEHHLKMILNDVLSFCSPDEASKLTVYLDQNVKSSIVHPINAYDGIRLHYKERDNLKFMICWPVSHVITSEMWETYDKVFTFLLQVKRAKYSLERLKFCDLKHQSDLGEYTMEVLTFRMKLLHFVNNFHNFVTTWLFCDRDLSCLPRAVSFQCIIDAYEHNVQLIRERCLLHSNMTDIYDAVLMIMNVAIIFSDYWRNGSSNVNIFLTMKRDYKDSLRILCAMIVNIGESHKFFLQLKRLILACDKDR